MLAPAVLFTALGALAPPRTWWTAAIAGGAYLVFLAALAGSGWLERHRVYERALVLGPTWPGARPYVIPVETINPASTTVHLRANRINQRLHQNGQPTMRTAVYSTRAVSLVGLHYDAAGPRARSGSRSLRVASALLGQQPLETGGTCRWVLGVKDPAPLVGALMTVLEPTGRGGPQAADQVLAAPIEEPGGQPVRAR